MSRPPTSTYSSHKAEIERLLDEFEKDLRIVRLRKALVFKPIDSG
jgi:hypothetical protein